MANNVQVEIYGTEDCHKSRSYRDELARLGVPFRFSDVRASDRASDEAGDRLRALYSDGELKFRAVVVKGKRLRNPSLAELEKTLLRASLLRTHVIHDEKTQRFVRHKQPSDAFVSYVWRDGRMLLTHIEVDPALRGKGIGVEVAEETFKLVRGLNHRARISCRYMRKVAARTVEDRTYFGLP